MRSIEASLNEVLAFWLSHERLQFGSGEGVNEAGLRHNEEEDLCAGEGRQLICLTRKGDKLNGVGRIRKKNYLFHNAYVKREQKKRLPLALMVATIRQQRSAYLLCAWKR
jgi:hypothetical protein